MSIAWQTSVSACGADTCANPNRTARSPSLGFAMDAAWETNAHPYTRSRSRRCSVQSIHAMVTYSRYESYSGHFRDNQTGLHDAKSGMPVPHAPIRLGRSRDGSAEPATGHPCQASPRLNDASSALRVGAIRLNCWTQFHRPRLANPSPGAQDCRGWTPRHRPTPFGQAHIVESLRFP